jgi:hypothetical protein
MMNADRQGDARLDRRAVVPVSVQCAQSPRPYSERPAVTDACNAPNRPPIERSLEPPAEINVIAGVERAPNRAAARCVGGDGIRCPGKAPKSGDR